MSPFNLAEYETVEERLDKFWSDHPMGRITTEMVSHDGETYVVKASVWRGFEADVRPGGTFMPPGATGYAQEITTERGVNATSALENCETSAIGRALANLGYAAKGKRPSREEMSKAASSPTRAPEPVRDGAERGEEVAEGTGEGSEAASSPHITTGTNVGPSEATDAQRWMDEYHPGKPHRMKRSETAPSLEFCTQGNGKCPYAVTVKGAVIK